MLLQEATTMQNGMRTRHCDRRPEPVPFLIPAGLFLFLGLRIIQHRRPISGSSAVVPLTLKVGL